jgi:hypothetical protein
MFISSVKIFVYGDKKRNIVYQFEENINKKVLQQSQQFKIGHEVLS